MKTLLDMNEEEKRQYFLEKYQDIEWIPESSLEEFYEGSDSEPDWTHKGVRYSMAYADDGRDGWLVYYRDFRNRNIPVEDHWDNVPNEFFPDLCTLAFNFVLKHDGRTIADYICDFNHINRYVVPVTPSFINDKERKH